MATAIVMFFTFIMLLILLRGWLVSLAWLPEQQTATLAVSSGGPGPVETVSANGVTRVRRLAWPRSGGRMTALANLNRDRDTPWV